MKRSPLKRQSSKRAKEMRLYAKERDAWLEKNGARCQWCECPIESGKAELHHTRGRAGRLLRDKRFWMCLCRPCHADVHERPNVARAHGLLAFPAEFNVYPA